MTILTYISFSYEHALNVINPHEIDQIKQFVKQSHEALHHKTGAGCHFLGWIDWPNTYDDIEFKRIKAVAEQIKQHSDILLVIGVGGSYVGARAAIEMLNHSFHNYLPKRKRQNPAIIFAGHHLSSTYMNDLFDILEDKDVSINVISKSGTTTEPAIAFRIYKQFLEKKYGVNEAKKRIFVTTNKEKGALKKLADEKGYETFVIPHNIGGRYSVLTAVGLLPIAVSGVNIDEIMQGAQTAFTALNEPTLVNNPAYQYAAIRNILYRKGKTIELLVSYEPHLHYFSEWWKQLFGESEGKDHKGIFPATAQFTTDLHALGQYIQDGRRHLFETVLHIKQPKHTITLTKDHENIDGLNYLEGQTIHAINEKALQGTILAHTTGHVPNLVINIPKLNAFTFGYLVYFFQKACAISSYLLGTNPFDQPGVEAYKENMFALLGHPQYKQKKDILENVWQEQKNN